MQDIDIVYLYEHATRELDVACAITSILQQQHGLRVEIIQWPHGFHRVAGRIHPRVVVVPFCYTERSYPTCLMEWRKAAFFNLTWEQLFYKGNLKAKTPRGDFAVNHVIHHSWSDRYASFLREQGILEDHIFVNGQPAYTLYNEPYRQYFEQQADLAAQHGLDMTKTWVFFPENYNWAFYSEATLNRFIQDGQSPDDVFAMKDFCTRSFQEVIKWLCDLAGHDQIEVIVRPRPSTSLAEFRAAVQRIIPSIPERLRIIQDKSVREWIMASDIVLSSHSTSLIEAAVAGKLAHIVAPYPILASLHQEWHTFVPRISTRQELLDVALHRSESAADRRLEHWAHNTLMSRGDAIQNLAGYMARLCKGDIPAPSVPPRQSVTPPGRIPLPKWFLFEYRRIRYQKIRQTPAKKIEPEYVKDMVNSAEIENRVSRWGQVLAGGRRA